MTDDGIKEIIAKGRRHQTKEYRLAHAYEMLEMWRDAEKKLSLSQSYGIGESRLTRVRLDEARKAIEYWENRIKEIETGRQGIRVRRALPLDI